ncbi:UNVERIFIED_CONTAM: hypothetical protein RMT77_009963 [Armadillidium vulgare]
MVAQDSTSFDEEPLSWLSCKRVTFLFVTLFLWVLYSVVLAYGIIFVCLFSKEMMDKSLGFILVIILFFIGALGFFNSIIGCGAFLAKSPNTIFMYLIGVMVVTSLVFTFIITLAAFLPLYEDMKSNNLMTMKESISYYDDLDPNQKMRNDWDKLQQQFECCGAESYKDWRELKWNSIKDSKSVPEVCCYRDRNGKIGKHCSSSALPHEVFTKGCNEIVYSYLKGNVPLILALLFVTSAVSSVNIGLGIYVCKFPEVSC